MILLALACIFISPHLQSLEAWEKNQLMRTQLLNAIATETQHESKSYYAMTEHNAECYAIKTHNVHHPKKVALKGMLESFFPTAISDIVLQFIPTYWQKQHALQTKLKITSLIYYDHSDDLSAYVYNEEKKLVEDFFTIRTENGNIHHDPDAAKHRAYGMLLASRRRIVNGDPADITISPHETFIAHIPRRSQNLYICNNQLSMAQNVVLGQEVELYSQDPYNPYKQYTAIAFSPCERFICLGRADGRMSIIQHASGREVDALIHPSGIAAIAVSSTGKSISAYLFNNRIITWNNDLGFSRYDHTNGLGPQSMSMDEPSEDLARTYPLGRLGLLWASSALCVDDCDSCRNSYEAYNRRRYSLACALCALSCCTVLYGIPCGILQTPILMSCASCPRYVRCCGLRPDSCPII